MRVSSSRRPPRRASCASGSSSRSSKRSVSLVALPARAAQQRAQPGDQLLARERLGQVVVGAGLEPRDPL